MVGLLFLKVEDPVPDGKTGGMCSPAAPLGDYRERRSL